MVTTMFAFLMLFIFFNAYVSIMTRFPMHDLEQEYYKTGLTGGQHYWDDPYNKGCPINTFVQVIKFQNLQKLLLERCSFATSSSDQDQNIGIWIVIWIMKIETNWIASQWKSLSHIYGIFLLQCRLINRNQCV